MAFALVKKALISNPQTIRNSLGLLYNASRNHWNYHYKPGPYPKTPEERAAAAKKYNLTIEEYEPYPEEMCYGDYPKLPDIGADSKDPFYPYDYPELKRNFNEPMHVRADFYGEDRYDISLKPRFSVAYQFSVFMGVITGSFLLFYFLEGYKIGRPVIAKQYPIAGKHYTFD